MKRFGILLGTLVVATSSLLGCGSPDPSDNDADELVAVEADALVKAAPVQVPLPGWGTKLYSGKCANDGFILADGGVYRVGGYVGPDVSGITIRDRTPNGEAVCHNIKSWTSLVQYACKVNSAEGNAIDTTVGTYEGYVASTSEWINGVEMQYPCETVDDGFYFGHSTFPNRDNLAEFPSGDPCPSSAEADLPLRRIECCANAPTL